VFDDPSPATVEVHVKTHIWYVELVPLIDTESLVAKSVRSNFQSVLKVIWANEDVAQNIKIYGWTSCCCTITDEV
jgi:hypothetical protein